jgi:hypothetical protein
VQAIKDRQLRSLVVDVWRFVSERNPQWTDIQRIPMHPTVPIDMHGNLVKHIIGIARLSTAVVTVYQELWDQDLDLDTFRAAAYVHDSAKVIEYVLRGDAITPIPGFNHAIEGGRVIRELGGPESLAHMVEAHSFAGPLVLPRTREAQLFMLLDPMCLNLFPEHGSGVVDRHLKANGWEDPETIKHYTR